ncbi:hypothetical protein [Endozoicomonas sp.]|uniref:hypothetical protein n=1 Tax=Endozoicomonas sp. TaxID=1892382 RepID=UPI0028838F25|nr:hypothetical protein [Endozoicomonas sp.]
MAQISGYVGSISNGQPIGKAHQRSDADHVGKVHWTRSRKVRAIAVGIGVLAVGAVVASIAVGFYAVAIAAGVVALVGGLATAGYFYAHRHDVAVSAEARPEAGSASFAPVMGGMLSDKPLSTGTGRGQGTPAPVPAGTRRKVGLGYFRNETQIKQIHDQLKNDMPNLQLETFKLFLNKTQVDLECFSNAAAKIPNDLAGVRVQVEGWLGNKQELKDMPVPVGESFEINGAVSPITYVKKFLDNEFKGGTTENAQRIKQQGESLDKDFYYQRVYGSGNCFYVAYLSGWLHDVLRRQEFDKAIGFLKSQNAYMDDVKQRGGVDRTNDLIEVLQKLKEDPNFKTIEDILSNNAKANYLAMYFRDFAVFGVENAVEILTNTGGVGKSGDPLLQYEKRPLGKIPQQDQCCRKVWGDDELIGVKADGKFEGGIIDKNADLQERMNKSGGLTKAAYCRVQREDMVDVQRAEIGILNDYFVPITMYQRFDLPADEIGSAKDGRSGSFGENNPIVMFRAPNHFDLLIPRKLGVLSPGH